MIEWISLLLLSLSLAMDAMAVSVTNGIRLSHCRVRDAVKMGVFFGAFQFLMPLFGFFLGGSVVSVIGKAAPYVSAAILFILGIRMIVEANRDKKEDGDEKKTKLGYGELTVQAIATSIDALAVGVSLSMAEGYGMGYVYYASAVIGIVAFGCSFFGALAGRKLGDLFERWAETAGGVVLILVGLKILLEGIIK